MRFLLLLGVLAVVARAQQRRAARRATEYSRTGTAILPVFLRHVGNDGARWMHGTVAIRPGEDPKWEADRDIANSRAVLAPSRFCVEEIRSGLSVSVRTKPGFVIMRMRSDLGPIELSMTPQDAATLKGLFPPCPHM